MAVHNVDHRDMKGAIRAFDENLSLKATRTDLYEF